MAVPSKPPVPWSPTRIVASVLAVVAVEVVLIVGALSLVGAVAAG